MEAERDSVGTVSGAWPGCPAARVVPGVPDHQARAPWAMAEVSGAVSWAGPYTMTSAQGCESSSRVNVVIPVPLPSCRPIITRSGGALPILDHSGQTTSRPPEPCGQFRGHYRAGLLATKWAGLLAAGGPISVALDSPATGDRFGWAHQLPRL